ncbi:MAG: DUF5678 domain-containing protein [Caldilineaceae bacterium]
MSVQVSITLSDRLSQRVRRLAQQRQEEIMTVIERILEEGLPETADEAQWVDLSEPDPHVEAEMRAYLALYPHLKERYGGQYVAIYEGQLVDHDADFDILYDRIDGAYPNQFVWISKIGEEPLETFTVRSPHFSAEP